MTTDRLTADYVAWLTLVDWRYLVGRLEAHFDCGSYSEGGALVARIGQLADEAGHHPAVDLRYPGVVHVATTSHDVHGVSQRDVDLALAISQAAKQAGAKSNPQATFAVQIAVDAVDIEAVRPFWKALLAYKDAPQGAEANEYDLADPNGRGPLVWFQRMDAPRTERNRLHIDVIVPEDLAERRVAEVIEAGGRLVSDEFARSFWVLADAEGNEACICTWQDRDASSDSGDSGADTGGS